jgi:DNA processing protein
LTFHISFLLTKACTIENQTLTMEKDELFYYLALQSVEGIGPVNARMLIEHCGSAKKVFDENQHKLKLIKGIGPLMLRELKSATPLKKAEYEMCFMEKHKISASTINDQTYPSKLKYCHDAPLVLFQKGKFDIRQRKIISIVGTRMMTAYGSQFLSEFIHSIKKHDPIVISGLAYGIDSCAHLESIKNNVSTVGVLAHGLDRIYPRSHYKLAEKMLEQGGLYSEFWSGSAPEKANFVKRNRIIAGISEATIVIESADRGGSLITADLAASYNRDVFAVPGRVKDTYSKGCNMLIKSNKAAMISSVKDLEYVLGWSSDLSQKPSVQKELFIVLDTNEKLLYEHLKKVKKTLLDQLSLEIGLSIQSTLMLLLQLELKGLVKSLPGKCYQAI